MADLDLEGCETICTTCEAKEKQILQLLYEVDHLNEVHELTVERKSKLMQDWLADQGLIHQLRVRLKEEGVESFA